MLSIMEMEASHHEAPSFPQMEPKADLIAVPSKRRSAGDEEADTDKPALKVAKLDTMVFRGIVDTRTKLPRLCPGCIELGNNLYEKRLEGQLTIPILRYPRDGGCVLCTILHEKATAMRRRYRQEPEKLFELKASPIYGDGTIRSLRLSPVGLDPPDRLHSSGRRDLVYRFFAPEGCDQRASLLRPVEVDFNKIRHWLNFCGNHHKTLCNQDAAEPWNGQYELMVMDCVEKCMGAATRTESLRNAKLCMGYFCAGVPA